MEVTATKTGYYGQIRNVGDVFEISKDVDFSDSWMQKTSDLNHSDESDSSAATPYVQADSNDDESVSRAGANPNETRPTKGRGRKSSELSY